MIIVRLRALALVAAIACATTMRAQESAATRAPNELGRIPVLEYHLIGERESRWSRSWQRFARDLELLHARGYRPVTIRQLVEGRLDVGAGLTPVVITFDDASPGQFRFVETNDSVRVDPHSALGVWEAFARRHPEWAGRAVFCVLPSADEGHAFFGDKGIQGQRTAWRLAKVRYLVTQGHEVCNHTLWHANLARMSDALVQEQIARAQLAIDSAVAGQKPRTFALPLGMWPKNRALLQRGSWRDPKSGRVTSYEMDAVLMVSGGAARSPKDPAFDAMRIPRIQVFGEELERWLARFERDIPRYVSAGGAPNRP